MGFTDGRYGQLDKKIVAELKNYEIEYFREGKPVPFCGLKIYPALVRDMEIFSGCTRCLTLNKNETAKGVAMSHLDYLISKLQDPEEGAQWSWSLNKLFEIIFHINNGIKCQKCGHVISYSDPLFQKFIQDSQEFVKAMQEQDMEKLETLKHPSLCCPECNEKDFTEMIKIVKDETSGKQCLKIDGHLIKPADYNRLRQIVLFQNFPDYIDESGIDPELRKDREEKMRLKQQQNDVHATIEQKVVCLSVTTNYKIKEIYDMSIREFTLLIAKVDELINYKIRRLAVESGFVSLPKGQTIEHWIYKPDKDVYGDEYKNADDIKQAVSGL